MATGWFQRATAVFGKPEATPQSFDIGCDCGARLLGIRVPVSQKPSCPACGTTVFVLPASVYPLPHSIQQRWGESDDGEGATPAAPTAPPSTTPKSTSAKSTTSPKSAKPNSGAVTSRERQRERRATTAADSTPLATERVTSWNARLLAAATPLRLIAAAVVFGLMLTVSVVYQKARRDHAQSVLQGAIDRGDLAVAERDFALAVTEYGTAVAALDLLGRQDAAARDVRQALKEAAVAENLLTTSLSEALTPWLTSSAAAPDIRLLAGESWILFDAPVTPLPASARKDAPVLSIDLPLMIDKTPVDLRIEGRRFASLLAGATPAKPRRLIFAAQLDRGELPTKDQKEARVYLKATSLLLLTDGPIAVELGLFPEDEKERESVVQVLKSQGEYLETQP